MCAWFNFTLQNHGYIQILSPIVNYIRQTLSACGHEVTVNTNSLYPDAINMYFEHFPDHPYIKQILDFHRSYPLRVGIVATELMIGGTIPYAKFGLNAGAASEVEARVKGFREALGIAGFAWCFLERTAAEYGGGATACDFFPVGHVRAEPAQLRRAPKDIDVLFFGRMTPHRHRILDAMKARGVVPTVVDSGASAEWLPDYVIESLADRAKIGLNLTLCGPEDFLGSLDPRFASCMRVTQLLERDVCIVSEDIPLDNPYRPYMISRPPEQLAEECLRLLADGTWAEAGRTAAARFRAEMDVTRVCAPVIARTLARMGL